MVTIEQPTIKKQSLARALNSGLYQPPAKVSNTKETVSNYSSTCASFQIAPKQHDFESKTDKGNVCGNNLQSSRPCRLEHTYLGLIVLASIVTCSYAAVPFGELDVCMIIQSDYIPNYHHLLVVSMIFGQQVQGIFNNVQLINNDVHENQAINEFNDENMFNDIISVYGEDYSEEQYSGIYDGGNGHQLVVSGQNISESQMQFMNANDQNENITNPCHRFDNTEETNITNDSIRAQENSVTSVQNLPAVPENILTDHMMPSNSVHLMNHLLITGRNTSQYFQIPNDIDLSMRNDNINSPFEETSQARGEQVDGENGHQLVVSGQNNSESQRQFMNTNDQNKNIKNPYHRFDNTEETNFTNDSIRAQENNFSSVQNLPAVPEDILTDHMMPSNGFHLMNNLLITCGNTSQYFQIHNDGDWSMGNDNINSPVEETSQARGEQVHMMVPSTALVVELEICDISPVNQSRRYIDIVSDNCFYTGNYPDNLEEIDDNMTVDNVHRELVVSDQNMSAIQSAVPYMGQLALSTTHINGRCETDKTPPDAICQPTDAENGERLLPRDQNVQLYHNRSIFVPNQAQLVLTPPTSVPEQLVRQQSIQSRSSDSLAVRSIPSGRDNQFVNTDDNEDNAEEV